MQKLLLTLFLVAFISPAYAGPGHDHGETSGSSTLSIPLMVYAGVMTLISLITLQMLMKRRQQESEAGNAQ